MKMVVPWPKDFPGTAVGQRTLNIAASGDARRRGIALAELKAAPGAAGLAQETRITGGKRRHQIKIPTTRRPARSRETERVAPCLG